MPDLTPEELGNVDTPIQFQTPPPVVPHEIAHNGVQFLQRAQVQGAELPALAQVVQFLLAQVAAHQERARAASGVQP